MPPCEQMRLKGSPWPAECVTVDNVMRTAWLVTLMRALVAGCAVAVTAWAKCPWPGTAGLGLLGGIAIAVELSGRRLPAAVWTCTLVIAGALSLLVPATPLLVADANFTLDAYARYYQAALAWLVAVSVVPAGIRADTAGRLRLWP